MRQEVATWEKRLQEEKNKAVLAANNKEKEIDKIKEYYQRAMAKQEKEFQNKR